MFIFVGFFAVFFPAFFFVALGCDEGRRGRVAGEEACVVVDVVAARVEKQLFSVVALCLQYADTYVGGCGHMC